MQVATVLSDLTSLQVCEPSAALALVSSRPNGTTQTADTAEDNVDADPDLQRAKDLVELHGSVKMAHRDGTDQELNAAREAVRKVLRELDAV